MDGKKLCKNCGEVLEGNFCSKCGKESLEMSNNSILAKVENIANPIIYMLILTFLFIASFFISIAFDGETQFSIFSFFGDIIKENNEYAEFLVEINGRERLLTYATIMMNLNNYISLIVIIANFVIQGTSLVLGLIFSISSLSKGKASKGYIFATLSYVSYLFTALAVAQSYGIYSMTTVSKIAIIVCGILLFAAVVFAQLKKGKKVISTKNIAKVLPVLICIAFCIVGAAYSGSDLVAEKGTEEGGVSPIMLLLMLVADSFNKSNMVAYNVSVALNTAVYFVNVVLIGLFSYLVFAILKSLFSDKKATNSFLTLSIITFMFAIANLVLSIILRREFIALYELNFSISLSTGAIIPIIMGGCALVCGILYAIFNRKNKNA